MLNSSAVTIEWSPPLLTQQNGPISHYVVTLHAHQSGDILVYNTTALFFHSYILHPFYSYDCMVTAVTVDSGPGTLISFQMEEDGETI